MSRLMHLPVTATTTLMAATMNLLTMRSNALVGSITTREQPPSSTPWRPSPRPRSLASST